MLANVVRSIAMAMLILHVSGFDSSVYQGGKADNLDAALPNEQADSISTPGIIALSSISTVVVFVFICYLVKRFCLNQRETAIVDVSETGLPQNIDATGCNCPPPPYPGTENILSIEENQTPPRYSWLFPTPD